MDIVARAQKICLSPDTEWPVIAGESANLGALVSNYALPLAGLSALGAFVGIAFFVGLGFTNGLMVAVTGLVTSLILVVVLSFIIDALAPTFGATSGGDNAAKVAAYAPTPAWICGLFQFVPVVGVLATIAGAIYSLYLLYLGLIRVMKAPRDKAVVYTVVVVVIAVVIGMVVNFVLAMLGMGGGMRIS